MRKLLELFLNFFKIGLFTFGGGYAMIGLIEDLCVEEKKWISEEEMMNLTVIAESTPGPIAINCATYVGYRRGGLAGAAVATAGVVLPSFIIIYLISRFFDRFLEIRIIANAFRGIRIAVGVIIISAGIKLIKALKPRKWEFLVIGGAAVLIAVSEFVSFRISTVVLMLLSAAIGLSVYAVHRKGGERL